MKCIKCTSEGAGILISGTILTQGQKYLWRTNLWGKSE